MKELNMTEAQLRSWQPRRPATGLKRQIFDTAKSEPVTVSAASSARWWWGVLAPATACFLFTLMGFNHGLDDLDGKPGLSLITGSQSFAAGATDTAQMAQNHIASVTFDWTNHSEIRSITGFHPTTNFIN